MPRRRRSRSRSGCRPRRTRAARHLLRRRRRLWRRRRRRSARRRRRPRRRGGGGRAAGEAPEDVGGDRAIRGGRALRRQRPGRPDRDVERAERAPGGREQGQAADDARAPGPARPPRGPGDGPRPQDGQEGRRARRRREDGDAHGEDRREGGGAGLRGFLRVSGPRAVQGQRRLLPRHGFVREARRPLGRRSPRRGALGPRRPRPLLRPRPRSRRRRLPADADEEVALRGDALGAALPAARGAVDVRPRAAVAPPRQRRQPPRVPRRLQRDADGAGHERRPLEGQARGGARSLERHDPGDGPRRRVPRKAPDRAALHVVPAAEEPAQELRHQVAERHQARPRRPLLRAQGARRPERRGHGRRRGLHDRRHDARAPLGPRPRARRDRSVDV
mmetsp:Transcript_1280/g.3968  ORF Transcript_1280/g.3968 Transcript_1280/m.3968 type:complete len:390 (-) Transcript_1280:28-1197(-)